VVNVASISGWSAQLAMPGQYGAAEAALIFRTERWALEFVPRGVRVTPSRRDRFSSRATAGYTIVMLFETGSRYQPPINYPPKCIWFPDAHQLTSDIHSSEDFLY
jgi:hypothetical protein